MYNEGHNKYVGFSGSRSYEILQYQLTETPVPDSLHWKGYWVTDLAEWTDRKESVKSVKSVIEKWIKTIRSWVTKTGPLFYLNDNIYNKV